MKKGTVVYSAVFQFFLYIVFGLGVCVGSFGLFNATWIWTNGGYFQDGYTDYQKSVLEAELYESELMYHPFDYGQEYPRDQAIFRELQYISERYNVTYVVESDSGAVLFDNTDGKTLSSPYKYHTSYFRPNVAGEEKEYHVSLYVDPNFAKHDEIRMIYSYSRRIFIYRYMLLWAGAIGATAAFFSLVGILKGAGHKKGQEGIAPGILRNFYAEVLGLVWLLGAIGLIWLWDGWIYDNLSLLVFGALEATVQAMWLLIFLRETAIRVKLGNLWSSSLVLRFCQGTWKLLRRIIMMFSRGLEDLPAIWQIMAAWFLILLVEAFVLLMWRAWDGLILWLIEKIILTPVILYCALALNRLQQGSRALAEGHFSEKVNTDRLILNFKKHGENLNRIGDGISKAIEERLKSERMKTELITNVSHDLKTPLTSVINYADLLGSLAERGSESRADLSDKENSDTADRGSNAVRGAQIKEYAEVLLRQANRLKRLLDDLVEASKATTGNLEVNPVPCELGVLLTQAAGEYEEKFEQKHLKLRVTRSEEEVRIMADSRHLWRIFDNLLNNIWKYAQEDSRVYLDMAVADRNVTLIFRNISKYELNVSVSELEERFVRGDASRHMEGSGLGLSIAKSLAELQGGTLEIVTDGDLFKVILTFPISFSEKI